MTCVFDRGERRLDETVPIDTLGMKPKRRTHAATVHDFRTPAGRDCSGRSSSPCPVVVFFVVGLPAGCSWDLHCACRYQECGRSRRGGLPPGRCAASARAVARRGQQRRPIRTDPELAFGSPGICASQSGLWRLFRARLEPDGASTEPRQQYGKRIMYACLAHFPMLSNASGLDNSSHPFGTRRTLADGRHGPNPRASYPDRPIKLVVPFPRAGRPTHQAQLVAQRTTAVSGNLSFTAIIAHEIPKSAEVVRITGVKVQETKNYNESGARVFRDISKMLR